jgi:hypothetical protein
MSDEYIALGGPDQYGKFAAMLITSRPAPEVPQRVSKIRYVDELESLKSDGESTRFVVTAYSQSNRGP